MAKTTFKAVHLEALNVAINSLKRKTLLKYIIRYINVIKF